MVSATFLVLLLLLGQCSLVWSNYDVELVKNGYAISNKGKYDSSSFQERSNILVVVLVSLNRKEYYNAIIDTYMNDIPTVMITEKLTPKCKLCGDTYKEGKVAALYSRTRYIEGSARSKMAEYYSWKPIGWRCAQQRHLQGLRKALIDFKQKQHDWVLLIDDDSYVNADNLVKELSQFNATEKHVFGNRIGGGAGFIFSAGAVEALLHSANSVEYRWSEQEQDWRSAGFASESVLDKCIEASLGGRYCFFHSDWLIKRCADAAGLSVGLRRGMHQNCPTPLKGLSNSTLLQAKASNNDINANAHNVSRASVLKSRMWREIITCHRIDPHTMRALHRVWRDQS